jgi:hypothetical protein
MRRFACLLALGSAAAVAGVPDVDSSAPSDVIVTVYRAPYRAGGHFDLNHLQGFALITETRTVRLPAGARRVRFEGVADGIEPASALVTGLPSAVIEKNRDARLLSPSALAARALGKQVELLRTLPKTGKTERRVGTILSDGEGVVFKTDEGVEALRCSGLPETFAFDNAEGLSARPTLSVLVRSPGPITQSVTLSYLSRGFDWSADYTATLSADEKTLDLGAWVTLANSNAVGFPSAHAQVVAGRVNRRAGRVDPIDIGGPILAQCWPRGSTSDSPPMVLAEASTNSDATDKIVLRRSLMKAVSAPAPASMAAFEGKVEQEQLGDLKLYRVPERTTLASRQSKQVRLLDRGAVPVTAVYGADLGDGFNQEVTGYWLLRTKNTPENHLGIPLPSGTVAVYRGEGSQRQLETEAALKDTAVGQEVEINQGASADVHVVMVVEKNQVDSAKAKLEPVLPGVLSVRSVPSRDLTRVEITNARSAPIQFELRLRQGAGDSIIRADHAMKTKDGRPIFYLTIPARGMVTVHYQTSKSR